MERNAAAGTLVLMGSGETTPTMVTTHKALLDRTRSRTGRDDVRARLLTTPYGFQENAGEITAKARQYFAHNVGVDVAAIDAGSLEDADGLTVERVRDEVRRSDWLFAGPGSPTYALRQWRAAGLADAIGQVHRGGGTVVLASAAAVTAGSHAVPVYEVYKAGQVPHWWEGLGLVEALTGWPAVVIPHFDNAEGGTHDTRFCYLGERRLSAMEAELPEGTWVLGVDEHTACIVDGDTATVRVEGRGGVHVRAGGEVVLTVGAGEERPMADLAAAGTGRLAEVGRPTETVAPGVVDAGSQLATGGPEGPFLDALAAEQGRFDDALAAQDAETATAAALATEQLIRDWSADTQVSDAAERGTAQLRGMITRLGALAGEGMHDHVELVRPVIETLLHVREDARQRKVYEVADHIRGHMDADGIRVKDTREGAVWEWDEPSDR
ncbi:Type 1 glutamine amidotransferase-like domain-containing protein [Euzebya sp.]|uniref:Type 1 glutamine amidotransferase-like domain-containing protein n=1 Tax=Euzebya sp. TaxID=1971409 RepID=UPI003514102C